MTHWKRRISFKFLQYFVAWLADRHAIVRVMSRKGTLFINTSLTEHLSTVPAVILSKKMMRW